MVGFGVGFENTMCGLLRHGTSEIFFYLHVTCETFNRYHKYPFPKSSIVSLLSYLSAISCGS